LQIVCKRYLEKSMTNSVTSNLTALPSLQNLVNNVHQYTQTDVLAPLSNPAGTLQLLENKSSIVWDVTKQALALIAQIEPLQACLQEDTSYLSPNDPLTPLAMQAKLDESECLQSKALNEVTDSAQQYQQMALAAVNLFNCMRPDWEGVKSPRDTLIKTANTLDIPSLGSMQPYEAYEAIAKRWHLLEENCIAAQIKFLNATFRHVRLTYFMSVGSCLADNAQWLGEYGLEDDASDRDTQQDWMQVFGDIKKEPFYTEWPSSCTLPAEEGIAQFFAPV
jgi:hypothetical protein